MGPLFSIFAQLLNNRSGDMLVIYPGPGANANRNCREPPRRTEPRRYRSPICRETPQFCAVAKAKPRVHQNNVENRTLKAKRLEPLPVSIPPLKLKTMLVSFRKSRQNLFLTVLKHGI
jgi:hypothetical protein